MWKIHGDHLRDAAKSPAAGQLYDILEAVFGKDGQRLPHALRGITPFVLCRDFCKSRRPHANGSATELYRFQLGPRVWEKSIYLFAGHVINDRLPRYEQEAESLAKQLKLAKWEDVGSALIGSDTAQLPDAAANKIAVTLCWQEGKRYCVIHDREKRQAHAFLWTSVGLSLLGEAHSGRLNRSEYSSTSPTFDRPILSLEEGAKAIKPAERAGQMEEFAAAIQWRYASHLDRRLDTLLLETCDRLQAIEGKIGMAFAAHRFNDAAGDDSWLAVRHDNFAWENGSYFRSGATSLRSASPEIHELLGILIHLQASEIKLAFNECYGYPVGDADVIGLLRQSDNYYFACCNSQGSCGPVYQVNLEQGRTILCGFTDRFDWNFNSGNRAGGLIPRGDILQIVTLGEIIRRVETGDTPYDSGPPHEMDVPWMAYLPRDPNE